MSAMVIHAAPAATHSVTSAAIRLTRRGRLIFFGVPALILAAAALLATMSIIFGSIASPAHASAEFTPVSMEDYASTVTVLQGESLWSIARETNPTRNAREVVQEIVALNELGAGMLHAGQQLFVPRPK